MSYEPEIVLEVVRRHYPRATNLTRPVSGETADLMLDAMAETVGRIFDSLLTALRDPARMQNRAGLRTLGKAIQLELRGTSNYPWTKLKLSYPFVSGGTVWSHLNPTAFNHLVMDEKKYVKEHVVPVTASVPGDRFLGNPGPYIDRMLTRAMLAPQCIVIGKEDRRIHSVDHPNPEFPFLRYHSEQLARPDLGSIEVYRVTDGSEVDVANYTEAQWEAEIETFPLLKSALKFHRSFLNWWPVNYPQLAKIIGSWRPIVFPPSARAAGAFSEAEQDAIYNLIVGLTLTAPITNTSQHIIQIPVRRERISVIILGHDGRPLFRIIIGSEQRRFALYHVYDPNQPGRNFMPEGLVCMNGLIDYLVSSGQLAFTNKPEPGRATRTLEYVDFEPDLTPFEMVMKAMPLIINGVFAQYPEWP